MPYGSLFPRDAQGIVVHRPVVSVPIPFASTCPKCRVQRAQRGDRGALERLLDYGHPIEAFCEICDEYWPVCARERAEIAWGIAGLMDDAGRPVVLIAWIDCSACGRIEKPAHEFNYPADMAEEMALSVWIPCEQCGVPAKLRLKWELQPLQ